MIVNNVLALEYENALLLQDARTFLQGILVVLGQLAVTPISSKPLSHDHTTVTNTLIADIGQERRIEHNVAQRRIPQRQLCAICGDDALNLRGDVELKVRTLPVFPKRPVPVGNIAFITIWEVEGFDSRKNGILRIRDGPDDTHGISFYTAKTVLIEIKK